MLFFKTFKSPCLHEILFFGLPYYWTSFLVKNVDIDLFIFYNLAKKYNFGRRGRKRKIAKVHSLITFARTLRKRFSLCVCACVGCETKDTESVWPAGCERTRTEERRRERDFKVTAHVIQPDLIFMPCALSRTGRPA